MKPNNRSSEDSAEQIRNIDANINAANAIVRLLVWQASAKSDELARAFEEQALETAQSIPASQVAACQMLATSIVEAYREPAKKAPKKSAKKPEKKGAKKK